MKQGFERVISNHSLSGSGTHRNIIHIDWKNVFSMKLRSIFKVILQSLLKFFQIFAGLIFKQNFIELIKVLKVKKLPCQNYILE